MIKGAGVEAGASICRSEEPAPPPYQRAIARGLAVNTQTSSSELALREANPVVLGRGSTARRRR